jgi:hypothetical protein
MLIVSTKEFRNNQRKYFDLAEKKVLVRRGKKYINLFVTNEPDNNLTECKTLDELNNFLDSL